MKEVKLLNKAIAKIAEQIRRGRDAKDLKIPPKKTAKPRQ